MSVENFENIAMKNYFFIQDKEIKVTYQIVTLCIYIWLFYLTYSEISFKIYENNISIKIVVKKYIMQYK